MEFFNLPIDVVFHVTEYLSESDCISLSLSGISKLYTQSYSRRRKLVFSRCFTIPPNLLEKFVNSHIDREAVRSLDLSHCYWLSRDVLIGIISKCNHIEELYIHDTKLHLLHLSQIFEQCPNVTKLSFSVTNESVHHPHSESAITFLQSYEKNFNRLTYVKMIIANTLPWPVWRTVLKILSWCLKCQDLHLEYYYPKDFNSNYHAETQAILAHNLLHSDGLAARLGWISNLRSFVFIKRGSYDHQDLISDELLNWIFQELKLRAVQHLWINCFGEKLIFKENIPRSLKSCMVSHLLLEVAYDKCHLASHIGSLKLSELGNVPDLSHVHGVYETDQEFEEFCSVHPMIEHLFVQFHGAPFFPLDVHLHRLKVLKYESTLRSYDAELLKRVVDSCPNLEEVHLCHSGLNSSVVLGSLHELKRLKKIVIHGDEYDADIYRQIFENCRRLDSLHLTWHFDSPLLGNMLCHEVPRMPELFQAGGAAVDFEFADQEMGADSRRKSGHILQNFFDILPSTKALRELRLQIRVSLRIALEEFLTAVAHCSLLERLMIAKEETRQSYQVIYFRNYGRDWNPLDSQAVIRFVSSCRHLISLCLVDECFSQLSIQDVSQKLRHQILPSRPAFWFYIGLQFPNACHEDQIPQIYYDQLIKPEVYSVPRFLS